jgi:transposase InsO family protein
MTEERNRLLDLVNEACAAGARQSKACDVIGLSARTLQRWRDPDNAGDDRLQRCQAPSNKLSEHERQRVIQTANAPEYANLPPNKIVPKLADQGQYLASESTFYRVLKDEKQLTHRRATKPATPRTKPRALSATGPNQLYSWDITYLPTVVQGLFFYLYLVLDIYSRKIVGWQVYAEESSALAADLMRDICAREGIQRDQVTLHSDNGSPMKGATLLTTLHVLGVMPSFSRPAVSNDNPYSESLFRMLKYRPEYPEKPFASLAETRRWIEWFVDWYNNAHLHSEIRYVTPAQRHRGEDRAVLEKRKQVYRLAKAKHPNRWSGDIRNWEPITTVYLNPEKSEVTPTENKAA